MGDWRAAGACLADSAAGRPEKQPERLAEALEVEVKWRSLPPSLWGVTLDKRHVVVNSSLAPEDQAFALAHELGHVLLRQSGSTWIGSREEEPICDEFARLIVSRANQAVPDWLAAWNRLLSGAPGDEYEDVDGSVVCVRCGPRRRHWPCKCHVLRAALRRQARSQLGD